VEVLLLNCVEVFDLGFWAAASRPKSYVKPFTQ